MTSNLKALVQKWRERANVARSNCVGAPMLDVSGQSRAFAAERCADELAREIERMESEPTGEDYLTVLSKSVPDEKILQNWSDITEYIKRRVASIVSHKITGGQS